MKYYKCYGIIMCWESPLSPMFEIGGVYNTFHVMLSNFENGNTKIQIDSTDGRTYKLVECDENGNTITRSYESPKGYVGKYSDEIINDAKKFIDDICSDDVVFEIDKNKAYDTEKQPPKYNDWAELIIEAYCE